VFADQALIYATVRRSLLPLAVVLACVLALPGAQAMAESAATLDCLHNGRLTGHYTVPELRNALATMPTDVREYNSECYQLILYQLNLQVGTLHITTTPTASGGSGSSLVSAPLLVALGVVVLVGGGFALAARRRRGDGPGGPDERDD